ncbi:MAG TPA: isoprenylcysteine carboxylmethyltransferase family protein [Steroidobacteraceae bacterium]|jgi:protein-S-isoprenylcysteine O-methyltransferase Ste14
MASLEVKIPPPAVAGIIAIAMWGTSRLAPLLQLPGTVRFGAAAAILLAGIGFSAGGVFAFRRARTTVNPTKPEQASSLVSAGIYQVTRNPMYVGLACVLVAWAVFLSSAWALPGPVAFVLYIGRFQITPEERALAKLFGTEYADYQSKVRRWL